MSHEQRERSSGSTSRGEMGVVVKECTGITINPQACICQGGENHIILAFDLHTRHVFLLFLFFLDLHLRGPEKKEHQQPETRQRYRRPDVGCLPIGGLSLACLLACLRAASLASSAGIASLKGVCVTYSSLSGASKKEGEKKAKRLAFL